jgi:hypothetical protein
MSGAEAKWRRRNPEPDPDVANMFGFKSEGDFFSVPPSVRDVPNVDFAAP